MGKKSLWDRAKEVAGAPYNAVKTAAEGGSVKDVLKAGGKASAGGQVISAVAGNNDSVLSKAASGDFGGAVDASKSHKAEKAATLAQQMKEKEDEQYAKNQEYSNAIVNQDNLYLGGVKQNVGKYQGDLDVLRGEIDADQRAAKVNYDTTIKPRMTDLMERSKKNADGAMTLQESMDPNNKVARGARDLYTNEGFKQRSAYDTQALAQRNAYDAEGLKQRDAYNTEADVTRNAYNQQGAGVQSQYEQQAQNEGRRGLADVGVLGALGMQNMAGQMGGVPMTGGQLQAMMGANQAQSGAAYSKTQQRLAGLRDQGIQGNIGLQNKGLDTSTTQRQTGLGRQSDLGATGLGRQSDLQTSGLSRQSDLGKYGIDQGFNRSDLAYNRGVAATDRYGNSIRDVEDASDRQFGRDTSFRGQRNGISGQTFGLNQLLTNETRNVGDARTMRDMAMYNQHAGYGQADLAGQVAGINAQRTADAAQTNGLITAGMTAAGTYFGGPGGGLAAGQAGKQIGNANTPTDQAIPQTGNYYKGGVGSNMAGPDAGGSSMDAGGSSMADGLALYGGDDTMNSRMRRKA